MQTNERQFAVVKDGAFYKLDVFEITAEGLKRVEDTQLDVRFVKGDKSDESVYRQQGIRIIDLLGMCSYHLDALNNTVPNDYTPEAIKHVEQAIEILKNRRVDRENRGVIDTYKG